MQISFGKRVEMFEKIKSIADEADGQIMIGVHMLASVVQNPIEITEEMLSEARKKAEGLKEALLHDYENKVKVVEDFISELNKEAEG